MNGKGLKKWNAVLLGMLLLGTLMHFAKDVLILLLFATLFSMLVAPVASKLEEKGFRRISSTATCILILLLSFGSIFTLIGLQLKKAGEQLVKMEPKATQFRAQAQDFIAARFGYSVQEQNQMIEKQKQGAGEKLKTTAKKFVSGVFGAVAGFAMVMLFTALFLHQREKYRRFVLRMYGEGDVTELQKVIDQVCKVAQQYLTGMTLSILILTTLYTIGFLIIGLQNAFLLAFVASVMVIIPYVGAWIGGLIPITMALVSGDPNQAISVAGILVGVQLIDNNFIEPYVVGGEVRLSFAATVVALLTGGALWGIPGVVLFVPLTGIFKIICDHVESMKPIGILIGDVGPPPSRNLRKIWSRITGRRKQAHSS